MVIRSLINFLECFVVLTLSPLRLVFSGLAHKCPVVPSNCRIIPGSSMDVQNSKLLPTKHWLRLE